jgi:hypothetical protein
MKRWESWEQCRDHISHIRVAIGEHLNGRGGEVWGKDSHGDFHRLSRVMVDRRGHPRGFDEHSSNEGFLLHAAEVRDK